MAKRAADTDHWLDQLADPGTPVTVDDISDLAAVSAAADGIDLAREILIDRVRVARHRGRSWTEIAHVLGISRQAARQRFRDQVPA